MNRPAASNADAATPPGDKAGPTGVLSFRPFHLDPADARLWRGKRPLRLRPKSFAVLHYLVIHAGRLVTKQELLNAVWGGVHVGDAVIKTAIKEIRQVLGDSVEAPRFVATVHRRGYRFIAPVDGGGPSAPVGPWSAARPSGSPFLPSEPLAAHPLAGRDAELARLHESLAQALAGERRVALVTGEPGIGKSTLLDAFLTPLAARSDLWLARGQCPRQEGPGEPYMSVLEAFGALCRTAGAGPVQAALNRYAPMWLALLPTLLSEAELDGLQQRVAGMASVRMLRQMAEAVEALTTGHRALVLVLDDLHWSDHATLELIDMLARRQPAARLLIIGAYRPAEVIAADHPLLALKQDLQLRGRCAEIAVEPLPEDAVAAYCAARFAGKEKGLASSLDALPRLVHERTGGHPLLMVAVADDLVRRGVIVHQHGHWSAAKPVQEISVPAGVQEFIGQEVERLDAEQQRVLEAASVAGLEFSASVVASALDTDSEAVEARCMDLLRRQRFLRPAGVAGWRVGTIAERFAFRHDLYREAVSRRLGAGRRRTLHLRIGTWREQAYGERAGEIAATLAVHFEEGREPLKAALYRRHATDQALLRHALHEAVAHAQRGLAILEHVVPGHGETPAGVPQRPHIARQTLELLIRLGPALSQTKGYAAPEVEPIYTRARELCQVVGDAPEQFAVLRGSWVFHLFRGDVEVAHEIAAQLVEVGGGIGDDRCLAEAYRALGAVSYWRGSFVEALDYLNKSLAFCDPDRDDADARRFGIDPEASSHGYLCWTLWFLGFPDQALDSARRALDRARHVAHPFTLTNVEASVAYLHQQRRELEPTLQHAESSFAISIEDGLLISSTSVSCMRGWVAAMSGRTTEGVAELRQALDGYRATGAAMNQTRFWSLLAEAYAQDGQIDQALSAVAEGLELASQTGQGFYLAELLRLKGELFLWRGATEAAPKAEACWWQALEVAREQRARSLELRTAVSLARLWSGQGERRRARDLLAPIYEAFTEGFDTADLTDARALLDELKGRERLLA